MASTRDQATWILSQIYNRVGNITDLEEKIRTEKERLKIEVAEYNSRRREICIQELIERGLTCCTSCKRTILIADVEYIHTEGIERRWRGCNNYFYEYCDFSRLHRACPECLDSFINRHGQVGPYDARAGSQEKFYAFLVEERDDGYYSLRFGNWEKILDSNVAEMEEVGINDELDDCLDQEKSWGIPPRIKVDEEGRLVVK